MSKQSIKQALAEAPVFEGLSDERLELLASRAKEISVEEGTCLFRGGDPAKQFYLLIDGEISIEIPAVTGPTLKVQHLKPVRVLGWSWLMSPYRWTFNARTESDCKLLEFDGEAVLADCEQDPAFGYQIVRRFSGLMAERLEAAHRKMMDQWSPAGFA
ncbi:MAG: cyclic nucleotide-binding domain-containing protein [Wenzhouxiangellaceae bacterium]|nr:cyclic nucleotide-binding domain-containing protein [Wenzhouxiangellaceae bacterium]